MKLSEELKWRGFVNQSTLKDLKELDDRRNVLYLGTDPTGDSLHVGHLASQMMARCFLEHGARVFLLIGSGTAQVGDPRDTEERDLMSLDTIEKNRKALATQVSNLFGEKSFELVDNSEWLDDISLLQFLRDTGKYFSMGQLIDREHFKARVGEDKSGMSFAEFTYTLLQGYDYFELYKRGGVNIQIGGADQWGNILSGVDLIRKKEGAEVHGLTVALVVDPATGRKFGKSESGEGVWLDPKKTSPYKFYQFWLNVSDEGAIAFLKLYTRLNKPEIDKLEAVTKKDPSSREAQKTLAYEVTKLVHGKTTADKVKHASETLFNSDGISDEDLSVLMQELPTFETGVGIIEILVKSGIAASNSEAHRLIKGNAIAVNGEKISEDLKIKELSLIKKGKNQFILVK